MSCQDDNTTVASSESSNTMIPSETSSLLGSKSIDGGDSEVQKYGSAAAEEARQKDPESGVTPREAAASSDEQGHGRRYSNAFIARTVVALLIGKPTTAVTDF